jgi:hypothetical protein
MVKVGFLVRLAEGADLLAEPPSIVPTDVIVAKLP